MDSPFNVNAKAAVSEVALGDAGTCLIVDNFLQDPHMARVAARHYRSRFRDEEGNAFPGAELPLPRSFTMSLARWWQDNASEYFRIGQYGCSVSARYSLVTRRPGELLPGQRLCHVDSEFRSQDRVGKHFAGVLYLFEDASLGGTVFFEPREGVDVKALFRDVRSLGVEELRTRHPVFKNTPCYHTDDNDYFRVLARVNAVFNRCIFYPSNIYHSGDIRYPEKLSDSVSQGRLTVNLFVEDLQRQNDPE